jgi:hypothetical protein
MQIDHADEIRLQHNDLAIYDTSAEADLTIEISFITSAFSPK